MKKTLIIITVFVTLITLYSNRPILNVKECTKELEEKITLQPSDFIETPSNSDDIYLYCDFKNQVGIYEATINYKYLTKKTKLIIQDITSPTFIEFPEELTIYVNEEILSHFKAYDLSPFKMTIQENIDATKP